jgi:hypothetical protein
VTTWRTRGVKSSDHHIRRARFWENALKRVRQLQIADLFDSEPCLILKNGDHLGAENRILEEKAPDVRVTVMLDD